jgi:O-antigen/teichoic acid export membrane protein
MSSTLANISYNSIAKALTMAVQAATTMILARTLGANDYGVIGVAMIVIGFLARFDDIGMTAALVQRKDADREVLATAQTLNLILAVLLFIAAQVAAPFTAEAFHNPAIPMVVRVLGVSFLLSAAGFIPTALMTRHLQFARLRSAAVAGTVARGLVAVTLALAGAKHWSLVAGVLASGLVSAILLRQFCPQRAPWRFDRTLARGMLSFGLPLWGSGILTFIVFNTDTFLIGTVKGTTELGYYTVAITWSMFVCSALSEVVHSVLFPRFAQLQFAREELAQRYARSLQGTIFVAFMANAALCACADGFVFTVLGKGTDRWLPCVVPLQVLCAYGALRATMEPVGSVVLALGRSRLLLWATLVPAGIELALLPWGVRHWGLPGIATLVTVAYALQWLVFAPFLVRELRFTPLRLLRLALPGALAAGAAIIAARSLGLGNPLLWPGLLFRAGIACVVFTVIHELLSRGSILAEVGLVIARVRQRQVLASA